MSNVQKIPSIPAVIKSSDSHPLHTGISVGFGDHTDLSALGDLGGIPEDNQGLAVTVLSHPTQYPSRVRKAVASTISEYNYVIKVLK